MSPLNQLSRSDLESLLRARRLDRTLTTMLPPLDPRDEYAIGPSGVTRLDEALGGGFPRGQLSEIVGSRSSGRASVLLRLAAAAAARGELVALIDALDMFDVASAEAAGVDLARLLWIRGHVVLHPGLCRDSNQRAMEQAIRALTLVLGAGHFGLVVFDAGEAPIDTLRRLPFTTWLRLQRMVEGSQTICLLVGSEPMARSSAGLTVRLGRVGQVGIRIDDQLFHGLELEARVTRARWHDRCGAERPSALAGEGDGQGRRAPRRVEDVCVSLSTTCA
jgi:hypothetical protein